MELIESHETLADRSLTAVVSADRLARAAGGSFAERSPLPASPAGTCLPSEAGTVGRPDWGSSAWSGVWGAVGRWCGACGWLQMRRIPSIMVSMGEVELGICQGKLSEDRGKNAAGPGMTNSHTTNATVRR